METLPVSRFHGVGPVTAAKMKRLGIETGAHLRDKPMAFLEKHFGSSAGWYHAIARGVDAIALASATGQPVDPAPTRAPRSRIGASVNVEQAIGSDIGLFARAGIADGSIEPYDFTDIDRTAQLGVSTTRCIR